MQRNRFAAPSSLFPSSFAPRAAIFDFDGTLANTADLWHRVDTIFLSRRDIPYPADYAQHLAALGFEGGARYTIERFGLDESVEEVCQEWTDLSHDLYRSEVHLRPGAQSYIQALRARGIPVALATTNGASVLEHMEHVDVSALFDQRVYASEVGSAKDRPDIYWEAARRIGANATSCVVFEDIAEAAHSAQAAGMIVCGVCTHHPTQDESALRAATDLWLDDWRDLLR